MKQMKIIRLGLLVLLVMLVAVSATFAQDTSLGLSEGDAALLAAASENSGAASSLSFDVTGTFNVAGVPDSGDVAVSFSGSGGANDEGFQVAFTGEATLEGETGTWEFEMRVIGDMFYINLGPVMGGWLGGSLDDLMSQAGALGGGMLPINPADMSDPEAMNDAMTELMGQPGFMEGIMALSTLDPADFVTQSRADQDGFAVFTTSLSFGQMMQTEEMQQFMTAIGEAAAAQGAEMEGFDASMLPMVAMLLQDSTLTLSQVVDPNSELIEGATIGLNMNLDPALLGAAGDPITINLSINVDLKGYGEPVEIVAPESFQDISEMLGAMAGMGS
jgi:hypothetical protein